MTAGNYHKMVTTRFRVSGTSLILFSVLCLSVMPPLIKVGLREAIDPIAPLETLLPVLWAVLFLNEPCSGAVAC